MRFTTTLALAAAAIGSALAQDSFVLGFNSGASDDTGKAKTQQDFETEFKTAKNLQGATGNFTAIRLYSNIQWQTTNTPIAAFAAAISTNTKLLLGVWASGTTSIDNELQALNSAIQQYGSKLTDLVIGISVGSEDLYRVSTAGIAAKAGVGNSPDNIVKFIQQTRKSLAGTALKNIKVTHVDTWTSWANSSNKAVIDNIDFVSVNAFPFYETEHNNTIDNAANLLSAALSATEAAAGNKDVWITETGWSYTGPDFGAAKSSVNAAAQYWQDVGCAIFGTRNVFWYTLRDSNPANQVKFAITDNLSTTPRFDLGCKQKKSLPSPSASGTSSASSKSTVAPTSSATSGSSTSNNSSSNASNSSSNSSSSNTPAAKTGTSAALSTSVSMANSMAMALSVVLTFAVWAL